MDRRLRSIMAAALAALVLQTCAAASKTSALVSKQHKVQQKIKIYQQKIAQKKGEARTALGQLTSTEHSLESAQSVLSRNKLKLLGAESDLSAIIKRLERTRRQLERRKDLLTRRVVDIYEGEDINYVNVVLGSADMWTFLTRAYYLKCILDSDASLIRQINADRLQIERDKAQQEQKVAEIGSLQVRLTEERDRVSSLADERRGQLAQIEHDKALYEDMLNRLEAQSRAIEDRIRQYQNTPKGRRSYARAFKGGLSMPCSGSITSHFGYRRHPILGVTKLHTGVDIAVPSGTAVCAAADGTVFEAGWNDAYGYMVIIDHGGGVTTLYGHNSKLLVHAGQDVKRGQIIARSGSTGYSTGPHCHFEKRINGTPVNPM